MTEIERRILEAIRRAIAAGRKPKRICLSREDLAELDRATGRPKRSCDGLPITLAVHSRIYSSCGGANSIPKSLRSPPSRRLTPAQRRLLHRVQQEPRVSL